MLNRRPRGSASCWVLACSTTSCLSLILSLTVWLPVLTELYNSSTPTQSPTQSLEWHVWSSSSGNNCNAVQRSLSSGASVYDWIMGFYLVPFRLPIPPTRFHSITGHWNVSLPSGASHWNGMFSRAEGQYIIIIIIMICGDREETINHIMGECSKLAQKEYKTRHDCVEIVINWENEVHPGRKNERWLCISELKRPAAPDIYIYIYI